MVCLVLQVSSVDFFDDFYPIEGDDFSKQSAIILLDIYDKNLLARIPLAKDFFLVEYTQGK